MSEPKSSWQAVGWKLQLLVFALCVAVVILRRPDSVLNPQLFAEDGIWYSEAYTRGWFHALLRARSGYFQTIPRLAAALSLWVPLRSAPLVMNAVGIVCQVLPVNLLLSERLKSLGPLLLRALLAAVYIFLPNTSEVHISVEEAQWHLALLACLVVLSVVPVSVVAKILDISVLAVAGLSGPFGILLLPEAIVLWWIRRERWRVVVASAVGVCAAVQLGAIVSSSLVMRPHVALGATPKLFLQILSGRVYLATLRGEHAFSQSTHLLGLVALAVLATGVVAYCFWKAPLEWKLFLSFCALVWIVSLRAPMVSRTTPQWQMLRDTPGLRYFFLPTLAFAWATIWCAVSDRPLWVRVPAAAIALTMLTGITKDWRYRPYVDHHFGEYAQRFASLAPGDGIAIPIEPDAWTLWLVKREAGCSDPPTGAVDLPLPQARLSRLERIVGWVAAPEEVHDIRIFVDRRFAQAAPRRFARPDVDQIFPESPVKYKGWDAMLDLSGIAAGPHEIEVRTAEDGCDVEIGAVPFVRGD